MTETQGTFQLAKYAGSRGKPDMGTFCPMTLAEAKVLGHDWNSTHVWFYANQGDARRAKINGKARTWKRDASRVEVPIKYGLYEYYTMTSADIADGRLLVEVSA